MPRRTRAGGWNVAVAALVTVGVASASVPMSPQEVRAQRRIREDRPLWRSLLAFPDDALHVIFWPIRQGLFWAERVDLPDRVEHVLDAPFRRDSEPAQSR